MTPRAIKANRDNAKKGGRPKGSLSDQARMQKEMRAMFTKRAREVFSELVEAQIDLARGVFTEEVVAVTTKKGTVKAKRRVYQRPPSQEAMKYVTDQAIGKAKESLDLNDTSKGAMTIEQLELMAAGKFDELAESMEENGAGDDDEPLFDDDHE